MGVKTTLAELYPTKAEQIERNKPKNNGGVLGGVGYTLEKLGLSALQGFEGLSDFTVGGISKLLGFDEFAESLFDNDVVNYQHADEWYNPSKGWQVAGDVTGGVGSSVPTFAAAVLAAAAVGGSGGAAAPAVVPMFAKAFPLTVAFGSAAGTSTKEAYRQTGNLGAKEFGYGALSGMAEAGMELVTQGIGTGSGRITKAILNKASGDTAKTLGRIGGKSVLKSIVGDFASEAFEEGTQEMLDGQFKRWTIDPMAENATPEEIAYAAIVGGLSGALMGGGYQAVNTTSSLISGNKAVKTGTAEWYMDAAKKITETESANETGFEPFKATKDAYNSLVKSLEKTGGTITTAKQKMLLGEIKSGVTASVFMPYIEKSAMETLANADVVAERLAKYKMTDANGKVINFSAEELTKGIDMSLANSTNAKDRQLFLKQVRQALSSNSALATVAIMDTTGNLMLDTQAFAEATIKGQNLASKVDLNKFVETASPEEISAVEQALGIDDISNVDINEFRQRVADYTTTADMQENVAQFKRMKDAKSIDPDKALPFPARFTAETQDGTYKQDDIVVFKDGDRYHIYDYNADKITRSLTEAEVNDTVDKLSEQATEQTERRSLSEEAKELDEYARANIKDYAKLNANNQAMIRKVLRNARRNGISESEALSYARISAHSGLDIVFDKKACERGLNKNGEMMYADGFYSPTQNKIIVNPDSSRSLEKTIIHELDHSIRMYYEKDGNIHSKSYEVAIGSVSEEDTLRIGEAYSKVDRKVSMLELLLDETNAFAAEQLLSNRNTLDRLVAEEPSIKDRILNFFKGASKDYSGDKNLEKASREYFKIYKKLFDELSARNQFNNALETPTALNAEAIKVRDSGNMSDSRFSLKFSKTIAENEKEYLKTHKKHITEEELQTAIDQTASMVRLMSKYQSILPKDTVGKTIVKNGSYDLSVENTTICIRTLAYNAFTDMVSEKLGRPLTQMESFLVSQKLYDIAKQPQCLYCYVSLDRKAYNEMVIRYIKERDAAVKAYKEAGEPEISKDSELFKKFLHGRKSTDNMWLRYSSWIKTYKNGERFITLKDVATEGKRIDLSKGTATQREQIKDILKYAQSASWAKKQTDYVAYFDDILKLSPKTIKDLNSHYGLRWYSFSDYSAAFIVENMQQITDASLRGLKGLSYTKDTDFAKIFAPTGMNVNISVFVKKTGDHYEIDSKQSADINEAIELRKKYPNVGIVAVATDDAGVQWALEQEWTDVVIPFHTVRTGKDVADFYDWTVFTKDQNDVIEDQNLWDAYVESLNLKSDNAKKKVSKMVYPHEHQNNKEEFLRITKERGLKPRFPQYLDNPNYMKLVNETRRADKDTPALKPIFNLEEAETSFNNFVETGGYYEGWYNDGVDVDAEAQIVADDVKAGKKANEVEYGRQDADFEKLTKMRKKVRKHSADTHFAIPLDITPAEKGIFENIQITKDHTGRYWSPKALETYFDENPEVDFITKIYNGNKAALPQLRAFVGKIDDEKLLQDYSYYVGGVFSDKGRYFDKSTFKAVYPYRGTVTKFRNVIKKRINEIMTAKNNGTNLQKVNGKTTLMETIDLYHKLNSNPQMEDFANKVFDTIKMLDAEKNLRIGFVNQLLSKDSRTLGDAIGNFVEYKTNYFNDTAVTDQNKADTILHELLHVATSYALYSYENGSERFADGRLTKLGEACQTLHRIYADIASDPEFANEYGIRDTHEMVAELSNQSFVDKLHKKNLWERIIDAICKIFGVERKSNAYEGMRTCVDYILDNPDFFMFKQHASVAYNAVESELKTRGLDINERFALPLDHKNAQFKIIQETNPMWDDFHTGIRSPKDILTFEEAIQDDESFTWGDFSKADAEEALEKGTVTVYSSYPIKNGTFVSTSYQQALEYAGRNRNGVHQRKVALDSVAWINGDEGQYAKVYALPLDQEYMEAVESNNISKASKLVESEALKWGAYAENGNPVELYHGTPYYKDINVFKKGKSGWLGGGIYLTSEKSIADRYAKSMGNGKTYSLYANVMKPLIVTSENPALEIIKAIYGRETVYKNRVAKQTNNTQLITSKDISKLQELGYDGILWDYANTKEFSVFNPNQIKSADTITYDDNGKVIPLSERFNENNNDIRYALQIGDIDVSTKGKYAIDTESAKFVDDINNQNSIENFLPKEIDGKFANAIARYGGFTYPRLYRGMEAKELQFIKDNGYIKSNSSYNFSYQQGETRFSPKVRTALSYATGFAPAGIREKFFDEGKPAYIVEVGNYPEISFKSDGSDESFTKERIDKKYITRILELKYDKDTDKVYAKDISIDGMNNAKSELVYGSPKLYKDKVTGTIIYEHQGIDGKEDGQFISSKNPDILFDFDMVKDFEGKDFDFNNYVGISGKRENFIPYEFNQKEKSDSKLLKESAYMSDERIDYLIDDSGAGMRKDYARAWITSINPTDFINMSTGQSQNRAIFDKTEGEHGSTMADYDFIQGLKSSMRQTPFLDIELPSGKVVGHEGRHRMRALEMRGIKRAEIQIRFYNEDGYPIKEMNGYGNPLNPIDSLKIINQFGTGQTTTIGNIIPLNKANRELILENYGEKTSKSDNDIRYAVPIDDTDPFFDDAEEEMPLSKVQEIKMKNTLAKGSPRKESTADKPLGQIKKIVANSTHNKVYSKSEAMRVIDALTGTQLSVTEKNKLGDALWQGLNDSTTQEKRETFAKDMAEYITAKLVTEATVDNPDIADATERISYIKTGVAKLTFSDTDKAEIKHMADVDGYRQILGRWGNKQKNGRAYPMATFVNDIATEMPGMSYLSEMHPADAFMEINKIYSDLLDTLHNKKINAYDEVPAIEIESMQNEIENAILQAFDTEGTKSKFKVLIDGRMEEWIQRAENYKTDISKIKARNKIIGQLVNDAYKMRDLKIGTFKNATQADTDIFKNSIEQLARIQFRGNINVTGIRKIFTELMKWYRKDNPVLNYESETSPGLYAQSVADMLETIATGEKALSNEELYVIHNTMAYFTKFVENYGKVYRQGKYVDAAPVAEKYVSKIQNIAQHEEYTPAIVKLLGNNAYFKGYSDPMAIARMADRYDPEGFFTETMYELRDAAVKADMAELKVKEDYNNFIFGTTTEKDGKKIKVKGHPKYIAESRKEDIDFKGEKISKLQLIGLYMTLKRKHAQAGYIFNGFKYKNSKGDEISVPGITDYRNAQTMTEEQLAKMVESELSAIATHFNATDLEYIRILEKAYNTDTKRLKAERDMARLGFTNASEAYYYPIRRADTKVSVDNPMQDEINRVTNSSFNKDTIKGAKQKLMIEDADSLFNRHVHAVCQYAMLVPAVETFDILYNMDVSGNRNAPVSVRTTSANIFKNSAGYFKELVKDIQGIKDFSSFGMKVLSFLRSGYAKYQLGANPKTWLTQLSSLFASTHVLDADSVIKGFHLSAKDVYDYSDVARLRSEDNQAIKADALIDKLGRVSDVLMMPIQKTDDLVIRRLYGACQVQVQKDQGLKIGTTENKKAAAKLLDKVIFETQQNSLATEKSAAMRTSNELLRSMTMFTSDMMKATGRVIDAVGGYFTLKKLSEKSASIEANSKKINTFKDAQGNQYTIGDKVELGDDFTEDFAKAISESKDGEVFSYGNDNYIMQFGELHHAQRYFAPRTATNAEVKAAAKSLRKSLSALVSVALFTAALSQLWRAFLKRDDDDEDKAKVMLLDSVGNLFAGMPVIKDIYAFMVDGYELENYTYSTINDVLSSTKALADSIGKLNSPDASRQDMNRAIRNMAYSVGQVFGLPFRNAYNLFFGLTKRFSPKTAYKIENGLYKKNFESDLYDAIDKGDDKKINFIMGMLLEEQGISNMDRTVFDEVVRLSGEGEKVLPKTVPTTITVGGERIALAQEEQDEISQYYSQAEKSLVRLIKSQGYRQLTDTQKADAIKLIYNVEYNNAVNGVFGIEKADKQRIMGEIVGNDVMAVFKVGTQDFTNDVDRRGNVVKDSKRRKVVNYINSMPISREEKLLLIAAKGYTVRDGDLRGLRKEQAMKILLNFIVRSNLSKSDKEYIAKMCGFTVKNGRIMNPFGRKY